MLDAMSNSSAACTVTSNTRRVVEAVFEYGVFILLSLVILVLLTLLQRRTRLWNKCCNGHIGLPVPMNFLISPRFRLPYLLIFAILANELLLDIVDISASTPDTVRRIPFLRVLYTIFITPFILVFFLGIKFFPLLACVEASPLLAGHCIGLVYSLLWFGDILRRAVYTYYERICSGEDFTTLEVVSTSLREIPTLCVCFSVFIWYTFQVIKHLFLAIVQKPYGDPEIKDYQLKRVKNLLKPPPAGAVNKVSLLLKKAMDFLFPYSKDFRLPLPFLCVLCGILMFLYQLSVAVATIGFASVTELAATYNEDLRPRLVPFLGLPERLDNAISTFAIGLPVVLVISPFVSFILCSLLLYHMVGAVSKIMKRAARDGYKEKLPGKLSILPSAWTYLGTQFGFFVNAWFIYLLLSLLLGVAAIVVILGLQLFTSFLVSTLLVLVVPVIWSKGIYYLQYLISKFVFFEDSTGKFISITNRRLFNWFAYILFIYNGFAGFVGAIIRLALSAGVTLLLLFRLDTVVLPAGFEFLDSGHRSLLGFLYLESTYNNSVVHTFIHLLREESRGSEGRSMPNLAAGDSSSTESSLPYHSMNRKQSRNRWLVAYTLINNPALQDLRARKLKGEMTTPPPTSPDPPDVEEIDSGETYA